jgi:serine/threonine protein kinase
LFLHQGHVHSWRFLTQGSFDMNELAGQSLGGYRLEEEIGRGSMGVVYRGKQLALNRDVAIKVLSKALARDASYVARFIREAQIIAGLNHPNIVQIFDAGQLNGLLYFVMEYVQGPTIAGLLQRAGSIPQYQAASYVAQVAGALDSAYRELNVIHRDIKPENLMLDRWGRIKVMDFGLARASGLQRITIAKTLVGSIYYASPEQIWGQTLDNRSDIYALGVVLYEMVCGRRPFRGLSLAEVTREILGGRYQAPRAYIPDISPELEGIILRAMALNRDERFAEAGQMAQRLHVFSLQAPAIASVAVTGRALRSKSVMFPRQRPRRLRRPLSLDVESVQGHTGEVASLLSAGTKAAEIESGLPTSPLHPAMPAAKRRLRRMRLQRPIFWKSFFQNRHPG